MYISFWNHKFRKEIGLAKNYANYHCLYILIFENNNESPVWLAAVRVVREQHGPLPRRRAQLLMEHVTQHGLHGRPVRHRAARHGALAGTRLVYLSFIKKWVNNKSFFTNKKTRKFSGITVYYSAKKLTLDKDAFDIMCQNDNMPVSTFLRETLAKKCLSSANNQSSIYNDNAKLKKEP